MAPRKKFSDLKQETMSPEAITRAEEKAEVMLESMDDDGLSCHVFRAGERVKSVKDPALVGDVRSVFCNKAGHNYVVVESDKTGLYISAEGDLEGI